MIILRGPALLSHITDLDIRSLVSTRFAQILSDEPYDYDSHGYMIVVEPGDSVADLEKETGCPILSNYFDGTQFGDPDFTPSYEALEEHASCHEMVFILSDGGFGVELFIPKTKGIDAELLAMCAEYSVPTFSITSVIDYAKPLNELVADMLSKFDVNLREDFEERAGIMEFDGELPRAHAECLALIDVLSRNPNALLGLTLLQVELNGVTQWLLTTDIDATRKHLAEGGRVAVDAHKLSDVIDECFNGIAVLTSAK